MAASVFKAFVTHPFTGNTGQTGPMMSVMFAAVGLQAAVVLGLSIAALGVAGGTASWHLVLGAHCHRAQRAVCAQTGAASGSSP